MDGHVLVDSFKTEAAAIQDYDHLVKFSIEIEEELNPSTEDRWREIFSTLNQLPEFVDKQNIFRELRSYDSAAYPTLIQNAFKKDALKFLSTGGDPQVIVGSTFLKSALKYRYLDIAHVNTQRKPHSPMEQLAEWEALGNYVHDARRTNAYIPVELKNIGNDEVVIREAVELPHWLRDLFIGENSVLMPVHPLSTSKNVPFTERSTAETWQGLLTASRSMIFFRDGRAFMIKMPTDFTNPMGESVPNTNRQKDQMQKSVIISMKRSHMIESIEARIGKDPRLIVLREVLSIADRVTGNGVTVRDLTPLMDGNYYLPGTATLDFLYGKNADLTEALTHDARIQGQAQALLLIRYGLQMKFPHRQNTLAQLTPQMGVTDNLVVRDMSDTMLVSSVAEVIDHDSLASDIKDGFVTSIRGQPDTLAVNSLHSAISPATHEYLSKVLRDSYKNTILHELGLTYYNSTEDPEFVAALIKYHRHLRDVHSGH